MDSVTLEDWGEETFAEGVGVKWRKWARGGGRNTPSCFILLKPDKPRPDGPLGSYADLTLHNFFFLLFQDDNRNLRTEVTTLREELTTLEAKYQDKYRNALRKNQDALAGIKDNEFR